MSETGIRELICIRCPVGCMLTVTGETGDLSVSGNSCPRGEEYGIQEVSDPRRMVTATIPVKGGVMTRLPVKTASAIPKGKIFECMAEIRKLQTKAPVSIGDIVLKNCAGTGVDIVACRDVGAA